MRELLRRWWAHRNLSGGRCRVCGRILADDPEHRPYCSEDCRDAGIW